MTLLFLLRNLKQYIPSSTSQCKCLCPTLHNKAHSHELTFFFFFRVKSHFSVSWFGPSVLRWSCAPGQRLWLDTQAVPQSTMLNTSASTTAAVTARTKKRTQNTAGLGPWHMLALTLACYSLQCLNLTLELKEKGSTLHDARMLELTSPENVCWGNSKSQHGTSSCSIMANSYTHHF